MSIPVRTMAWLLLAGLAGLASACGDDTRNPGPPGVGLVALVGTVVEVLHGGDHAFVDLEIRAGQRVWIVGPATRLTRGDRVQVPPGTLMTDFRSPELDRVFDRVYFVREIRPVRPADPARPPSGSGREPTVAELHAAGPALAGRTVAVRGKVVRVTANVQGVNWIHVQDGTGDRARGTDDLTVTTKAAVVVGDMVRVTGTLSVNRREAMGRVYPVIVLNADVVVETP